MFGVETTPEENEAVVITFGYVPGDGDANAQRFLAAVYAYNRLWEQYFRHVAANPPMPGGGPSGGGGETDGPTTGGGDTPPPTPPPGDGPIPADDVLDWADDLRNNGERLGHTYKGRSILEDDSGTISFGTSLPICVFGEGREEIVGSIREHELGHADIYYELNRLLCGLDFTSLNAAARFAADADQAADGRDTDSDGNPQSSYERSTNHTGAPAEGGVESHSNAGIEDAKTKNPGALK